VTDRDRLERASGVVAAQVALQTELRRRRRRGAVREERVRDGHGELAGEQRGDVVRALGVTDQQLDVVETTSSQPAGHVDARPTRRHHELTAAGPDPGPGTAGPATADPATADITQQRGHVRSHQHERFTRLSQQHRCVTPYGKRVPVTVKLAAN